MANDYQGIHSTRQIVTRLCTSSSSSTETIRTLAPGSHVSELEVKKSRFLGYATHAENWDDAITYIEQVKAEHPKARHWCYGFQCGYNPVNERCSDDGEPTGTAGVPILGTAGNLHRPSLIASQVWSGLVLNLFANFLSGALIHLLGLFVLGAIKGERLSDVVCVVVRYFGT